jgi:alpha-glucoside transport system substrate-binding protein
MAVDRPPTPADPPSTQVGRRTVLRAAALAAAAPLVTACGAMDDLFALDTIRVAVSWSDTELAAFRSVLDEFQRQYTQYQVDVIPLGDGISDALSSGANGKPDIVMLPRPGLIDDQFDQLAPLPAGTWHESYLSSDWKDLVWRRGVPYGLPFKVANQSALWYRKDLFDAHGLAAPVTWSDWLALNDSLIRLGIAPLALGAGDGWPLAAFFDNVLRGSHGDVYDRLGRPDAPAELWRGTEFVEALRLLGEMLSVDGVLSGGVDRSLAMQYPDAVVEVFGYHRAAMVVSADFAEPIIEEFRRSPDVVDVVPFPTFDSPRFRGFPLVIGADIAVLTKPVGAGATALVKWLAGPDAPMPWIRNHGGFIAANLRTPTSGYTDSVSKLAFQVNTKKSGFGLSDELGSTGSSGGLWQVLEDFLRTVGDGRTYRVDDAAVTAAERMYDLESHHDH